MKKGKSYYVVCTQTKLFVYTNEKCNELVGMAGVTRPRDFDYLTLYKLALWTGDKKDE